MVTRVGVQFHDDVYDNPMWDIRIIAHLSPCDIYHHVRSLHDDW